MIHISQRDLVRASLACTHHPDVYFTRVVPGEQRAASHGGSVPARVQASGGEERGCDPCPPTPTACTGCGRRWGLLTSDRYMSGKSSWNGDTCPACVWDRDCESADDGRTVTDRLDGMLPRLIPGTNRIV